MHSGGHAVRLAVGKLQISTGEAQLALRKALRQFVDLAEVACGPKINPAITGSGHLVEHLQPVGNVGIDADRNFERTEADGGVGHDDFGSLGPRLRGHVRRLTHLVLCL